MVDNSNMTPVRSNPIPLPAAVLALSVAVCIGTAGSAGASPMLFERATQAEQRQTLEHLLDVISQAAKKLTDQLFGQSAQFDREARRPALALAPESAPSWVDATTPAVLPLREALLNLPPPVC